MMIDKSYSLVDCPDVLSLVIQIDQSVRRTFWLHRASGARIGDDQYSIKGTNGEDVTLDSKREFIRAATAFTDVQSFSFQAAYGGYFPFRGSRSVWLRGHRSGDMKSLLATYLERKKPPKSENWQINVNIGMHRGLLCCRLPFINRAYEIVDNLFLPYRPNAKEIVVESLPQKKL